MPIVDLNYINASLDDLASKTVWNAYLGAQDGVTATPSGSQATALLINAMTTRVTTVATAGDAIELPLSSGGLFLTVVNAAATNAMNVFPRPNEQINALGANNAFSVAAGKACFFVGTSKGQWHTVLSA